MNNQALIKAKRDLFHQLLLKDYKHYTPGEIDMMSALVDDRDIQDHLEKHRQADQAKRTG